MTEKLVRLSKWSLDVNPKALFIFQAIKSTQSRNLPHHQTAPLFTPPRFATVRPRNLPHFLQERTGNEGGGEVTDAFDFQGYALLAGHADDAADKAFKFALLDAHLVVALEMATRNGEGHDMGIGGDGGTNDVLHDVFRKNDGRTEARLALGLLCLVEIIADVSGRWGWRLDDGMRLYARHTCKNQIGEERLLDALLLPQYDSLHILHRHISGYVFSF